MNRIKFILLFFISILFSSRNGERFSKICDKKSVFFGSIFWLNWNWIDWIICSQGNHPKLFDNISLVRQLRVTFWFKTFKILDVHIYFFFFFLFWIFWLVTLGSFLKFDGQNRRFVRVESKELFVTVPRTGFYLTSVRFKLALSRVISRRTLASLIGNIGCFNEFWRFRSVEMSWAYLIRLTLRLHISWANYWLILGHHTFQYNSKKLPYKFILYLQSILFL